MVSHTTKISRFMLSVLVFFLCLMLASPAFSVGYDNALKGVKSFKVVYDVSTGDPKMANIVFWAVKNSYEVKEVNSLTNKPNVAVVFHGPAVKLLSTAKSSFNEAEWGEVEKFQKTLRQMKNDGAQLEICLYAAEVMGVDNSSIIPEIDQVGNGFVSIVGYQMQGYAVVRIP